MNLNNDGLIKVSKLMLELVSKLEYLEKQVNITNLKLESHIDTSNSSLGSRVEVLEKLIKQVLDTQELLNEGVYEHHWSILILFLMCGILSLLMLLR